MSLLLEKEEDGETRALIIMFGSYQGGGEKLMPPNVGWEGRTSRFFPGYIALRWRDRYGWNPGFAWSVLQYGEPSPEMPHGIRITIRSFFLFGNRLLGGFA